jgi:RimJ/RimL family protein N-acetyltransferase
MHVLLETERLVLRRFTEADVDALVALDADPEVMRYVTGGVPTPRYEIETEILPAYLRYHERFEGLGYWATVEKATDAFVGWFEFRPPAEGVELGYRLRRAAWGKGFATEGALALIDKGFAELGVERVVAHTLVVHAASRRVLEKVGLPYVRTFHADWPYRIDGDEHGDVEYALTRSEWEERRAP